jgi:hydrogenase expression/formation protein HypD
VPIVVTGFEPVDLLEGLWMLLGQLEAGRAEVENQYARAVRRVGNREAQAAVAEVYEVCDRPWRGLGVIPQSGLRLRDAYRDLDAEHRFAVGDLRTAEAADCHSGEVLQGLLRPDECPAFGTRCTPDSPLGAPMVSAEGACAAYWKYGRRTG